MIAAANRFYASSSYLTTCSYDRLSCPLCKKLLQKYNLRDHINVVHLKRRRYHCAWPGCAEAFGYFSNSRSHLRRVHRSTFELVLFLVQPFGIFEPEEDEEEVEGELRQESPLLLPLSHSLNHHFTKMSRRSNPAEELVRRTAHRETFRNLAHQLQCLKRRYNVLYGVTTDTASSSNQAEQVSPQQQQQPNSRAFILRKLKYALRTAVRGLLSTSLPPDRCTVLLLFDSNEEAFFEIRLKPKAWPVNWPTGLDWGSADGIDVELLSGAIYMKVLEAFNEEDGIGGVEEPPRTSGVVSSSGSNCGGPRSSVVEENGLRRVIVKSEEEEIVIDDSEDEEEETAENNVHASEQVNRRASADGYVNNGDQQNQQQEEAEETEEEEEEAMEINNMLQEENLAGRPRREGSGSILPSSATEPTADNSSSSSSLNVRRKRPLESTSSSESLQNHPLPPLKKRTDSSTSSSQSAQAASIAERFLASAAFQTAAPRNDRLNCPLCGRHYEKVTLVDHLNVVHFRRPRLYRCSWPGCRFTNQWKVNAENHVVGVHKDDPGRYVEVSFTPGAAQATTVACYFHLGVAAAAAISTPAAAASTFTSASASTSTSTDWARAEAFFRSPAFTAASSSSSASKLPCPFCRSQFRKIYLRDHIYGKHFSLKPYRCTYPGCTTSGINGFGFGFLSQAQAHVKRVHRLAENTGRYIDRRDPLGPTGSLAVAASSTFASASTSSSSSSSVGVAANPPPPPRPRAKARASRGSRAPPPALAAFNAQLSSPSEMTATADRFIASSAYQSARARTRLPCPLCEKPITKFTLTDHLNAVHLGRRRYHCAWPDGCAKAFGYRGDCQKHLRRAHQSTEYERYLQVRE
ncbi:hypothetical protein TYRP_008982 [Tyrophagus putrescentiae]|nr:hypothetical protein TYRP_008982 [Tyrophagus putrescentiae]